METVRALSLWLGAALTGSLAGTIILTTVSRGGWPGTSFRMLLAFVITTLFFTVPGSSLLSLAFAWTGQRRIALALRLALLVPFGAVVGGALMALTGAFSMAVAGLTYGAATGVGWGALHVVLYGRSIRKASSADPT